MTDKIIDFPQEKAQPRTEGGTPKTPHKEGKVCAACQTKHSIAWYTIVGVAYCDPCGDNLYDWAKCSMENDDKWIRIEQILEWSRHHEANSSQKDDKST